MIKKKKNVQFVYVISFFGHFQLLELSTQSVRPGRRDPKRPDWGETSRFRWPPAGALRCGPNRRAWHGRPTWKLMDEDVICVDVPTFGSRADLIKSFITSTVDTAPPTLVTTRPADVIRIRTFQCTHHTQTGTRWSSFKIWAENLYISFSLKLR